MDVMLTKDNDSYLLSRFNIDVTSFEENAPEISPNLVSISGRNGTLSNGANLTSKKIDVKGYFKSDNLFDEEELREEIFALLISEKPYYITQMIELHNKKFERPGETIGELRDNINVQASHKRFLVFATDVDVELKGNSPQIIYELTLSFVTSGLPYGESLPSDISVNNGYSVPYRGTATNRQLETGFYIELTANDSGNGFEFSIDDQTLTFNGAYSAGDVFKMRGYLYTRNELNINDKTNYQTLSLDRNKLNRINTNFAGTVIIKDVINYYL